MAPLGPPTYSPPFTWSDKCEGQVNWEEKIRYFSTLSKFYLDVFITIYLGFLLKVRKLYFLPSEFKTFKQRQIWKNVNNIRYRYVKFQAHLLTFDTHNVHLDWPCICEIQ